MTHATFGETVALKLIEVFEESPVGKFPALKSQLELQRRSTYSVRLIGAG